MLTLHMKNWGSLYVSVCEGKRGRERWKWQYGNNIGISPKNLRTMRWFSLRRGTTLVKLLTEPEVLFCKAEVRESVLMTHMLLTIMKWDKVWEAVLSSVYACLLYLLSKLVNGKTKTRTQVSWVPSISLKNFPQMTQLAVHFSLVT